MSRMFNMKSKAKENERKFKQICKKLGCESISFWIPPNSSPTQEQAVAEVLNTLTSFEKDGRLGRLKCANGTIL